MVERLYFMGKPGVQFRSAKKPTFADFVGWNRTVFGFALHRLRMQVQEPGGLLRIEQRLKDVGRCECG